MNLFVSHGVSGFPAKKSCRFDCARRNSDGFFRMPGAIFLRGNFESMKFVTWWHCSAHHFLINLLTGRHFLLLNIFFVWAQYFFFEYNIFFSNKIFCSQNINKKSQIHFLIIRRRMIHQPNKNNPII